MCRPSHSYTPKRYYRNRFPTQHRTYLPQLCANGLQFVAKTYHAVEQSPVRYHSGKSTKLAFFIFSMRLTVGQKYFILYNLTRPLTYSPFTASGAIRCEYGNNAMSLTSIRIAVASHLQIKIRIHRKSTLASSLALSTKLPYD